MVSATEGMVYYCSVFLTALVFLTEASAITTNYEKSTAQNKTNETPEVPQRTKLTATRSRGNFKNHHDRVTPLVLNKFKSANIEAPPSKPDRELLIPTNSGGGGDDIPKNAGTVGDDDDQKTLSEQVADGKYGLIQHEIFTEKPLRPGIISYDVNPEVPKDNINNLGGLEPDDIWLAENHLLVLAGNFNNGLQTRWRPIDNYIAPKRPVKLPANPNVPPPFPVQLHDNGPIEYIKSNGAPVPSFIPFFNPLATQYATFNKTPNFVQPLYGKLPISQYGPPGAPVKPSQPPVSIKPPPGAEFVPPYLGANLTDPVDEDDPSLYYPPPYDFFYARDNTSKVPPGPLVPGIVLPPPPDFFALLANKTSHTDPPTKPKPTYSYKLAKQLDYPRILQDQYKPSEAPKQTVTYDDIINEVTYPHPKDDQITYSDIKANKVSTDETEDWIPIPAPKPYYITGPKKPSKNTLLVMMPPLAERLPKNGYAYEKPVRPLKIVAVDTTTVRQPSTKRTKIKFANYVGRFPDVYSTTSPTDSSTSTTPHPAVDTIKATYYFYEEPAFSEPPVTKPGYSASFTTPSPLKPKTPQKPHTVQSKRKPITPMIPIYYLAELENIVDLVKPMNLPYPDTDANYYTSTTKPTYSINKPNYERPTSRPIFEYSYVASDYSGQSGQISPSTPSYQPPYQPQYYNPYYQQYQPIYNPIDYNKPLQSTIAPLIDAILSDKPLFAGQPYQLPNQDYSFDRPWLPNTQYNQISYPTDNPYYAFFTKEEADLIDENTKKYFTIFGQKIKNLDTTTPIPVQSASSTTARWTNRDKYTKPTQPSQSITSNYLDRPNYGLNYYTSTVPYTSEYTTDKTQEKSPSLRDDTLVNYVTPLPTNPDAEYITPKLSKQHIRPIVVEDLPPDVNERLKNLMADYRRSNKQDSATERYRYVLVDHPNQNTYSTTTPVSSDHLRLDYRTSNTEPHTRYADSSRNQRYQHSDDDAESVSSQNDILVNYKNKHHDSESPTRNDNHKANGDANVISYKYPGVDGHFYFLTPQETHLTQIENERFNFQSDVEKPAGYIKRKPRRDDTESTTIKTR